jgi:hypothetical protein
MPVSTAIIWLKAASAILMIGFGLMFAVAAWPPTSGIATMFVDLLFWPLDGAQSLAAPETRIILAIGGGITVGWGVLVWQVASHVMPSEPAMARQILTRSLAAWFIIDSTCSWLAGAPLNIAANAAFLMVFLWPLMRMRGGADAVDRKINTD